MVLGRSSLDRLLDCLGGGGGIGGKQVFLCVEGLG